MGCASPTRVCARRAYFPNFILRGLIDPARPSISPFSCGTATLGCAPSLVAAQHCCSRSSNFPLQQPFFHFFCVPVIFTGAAQVPFGLFDLPLNFSRRAPATAAIDFNLPSGVPQTSRSEEHTSELQSLTNLVCRLLLEKKK